MSKRLVIIQPNYIPWKGYFDLIASGDECILYDTVQYTRQDWRNRNRIKTPQGPRWITVPVTHISLSQRISEIEVADSAWAQEHWKKLQQSYQHAPHFADMAPWLEDLYARATKEKYLSRINGIFIEAICKMLEIRTAIRATPEFTPSGEKNTDLIGLCRASGASAYISGEKAKAYIDEEKFNEAGIEVQWMKYEGYREYEQLYPPFLHEVSVLDMLFHTGENAAEYLLTSALMKL